MKIAVQTLAGTELRKIELPQQFDEEIRADLIQRAVHALQANARQKYGSDPRAGKKASINVSRRRRDYRGSYGKGISRVPRKVHSVRGSQINWTGAFAPGMVGGRRSHPPKAEKNWEQKLNKKENRKAIRSALAASMNKDMVASRGHKIPDNYPFAIEEKAEKIEKAKELLDILKKLGLGAELSRASVSTIRSGRGKMRGRKLKKKKGPLLVVSEKCGLIKNQNLPGIDVVAVSSLNANLLAPGGMPGRLTIFTDKALSSLEKKKLFM